MIRTITCSCGEALRSDDEEELYTFIRAHAVRLQPEPHQLLEIQAREPVASGATPPRPDSPKHPVLS